MLKPTTTFSHFDELDMRVGRIAKVEDAATRKPTYRLTIDFGSEIGTRVSCGAYRNYPNEHLLNKQVICLMNVGSRKMGPEVSEVLVLGVPISDGGTSFLTPETPVKDGVAVF